MNIVIPPFTNELDKSGRSSTNKLINADLTKTVGIEESDVSNNVDPVRLIGPPLDSDDGSENSTSAPKSRETHRSRPSFEESGTTQPKLDADYHESTLSEGHIVTDAASSILHSSNQTIQQFNSSVSSTVVNETEHIANSLVKVLASVDKLPTSSTVLYPVSGCVTDICSEFSLTQKCLHFASLEIRRLILSTTLSPPANTTAASHASASVPASAPAIAPSTIHVATTPATTTTPMSEENKKAITKSLINEVMDEARRQRLAPNPDDIARATQGLKDGAPCMFTICQYHNPLHTPVCFFAGGSDHQNDKCCRKPLRLKCDNNRPPQTVMRFYRNVSARIMNSDTSVQCRRANRNVSRTAIRTAVWLRRPTIRR
jgi:hypothetical protein